MKREEIFLDVTTGEGEKTAFPCFLSQQLMTNMEFSSVWSPHHRRLVNSVAKTLNENGSWMHKRGATKKEIQGKEIFFTHAVHTWFPNHSDESIHCWDICHTLHRPLRATNQRCSQVTAVTCKPTVFNCQSQDNK